MKNPTEEASWLKLPEDVPEEMTGLFAKAESLLGFVPNVFVGYTLRPTHFRAWFSHFRAIVEGESELSRAEREMIGIAVSAENDCLYCLISHGSDLRGLINDPVQGDRIVIDWRRAGLDERTTAMLTYAVKLTNHPVDCTEQDLDTLRAAGFSEQAVFDIIETTSMYNFTNRMASGSGMMPNREYHSMHR